MPYIDSIYGSDVTRSLIAAALEPGSSVNDLRSAAEQLCDALSDSTITLASGADYPSDINDAVRWGLRSLDIALYRLDIDNPMIDQDAWDIVDRFDPEVDGAEARARRTTARALAPVYEALRAIDRRRLARHVAEVSTGWPTVDEKINGLREAFAKADSADDWRDVGRRGDGLMEAVGKAATESLGDRIKLDETSPKDAAGIAALLSAAARGGTHSKLRKILNESADLASTASPFIEASAALLTRLDDLAKAADSYANHVKHSARVEEQAAIAVESTILFASMARHATALVLAEDEDASIA